MLSIEALLSFVLSLAFIAALFHSLTIEADGLKGRIGEYQSIVRAESAARAIEALSISGIGRVESADVISSIGGSGATCTGYRIEGGVLHADYPGKVVEIRGVFENDGAEPA